MKENLLSGNRYIYNNENWCVANESDEYYGAEVWHCSGMGWMNGFKIQFNGALIHSTVTFPPMQKALNRLIAKYHLELVSIEK